MKHWLEFLLVALIFGATVLILTACGTYKPDSGWRCRSKFVKCTENLPPKKTVPEYDFKLDWDTN